MTRRGEGLKANIVELLDRAPGATFTVRQLTERLAQKEVSVRTVLGMLAKEGSIMRTGRGAYACKAGDPEDS